MGMTKGCTYCSAIPLVLLLDPTVKSHFDNFFDVLLLLGIAICVVCVVIFIQMMRKQKELKDSGYRKTTTPTFWYVVYFFTLLSFIFGIVSLFLVVVQKKRIERIYLSFLRKQNAINDKNQ